MFQIPKKMFNKMIVYEALKHSLTQESNRMLATGNQTKGQDSSISLLIHDVFGGEILKTHKKRNWHFYNRIDGERIDFTGTSAKSRAVITEFEDIPADPNETAAYVDETDYRTFLMRFVRAFEEAVGLEKYQNGYSI
jgi:hypothetical protein